ncbi:hypothetical protein GGF46_004185 [Coemansia sp. RSA 552]|nr:hypothetical protein GGF46_004185 [Coemansia sp. RSA 552]
MGDSAGCKRKRIAPSAVCAEAQSSDWQVRRVPGPPIEWTAEEKRVVAGELQHGRKSPMAIVRALNGSRSLGQVADYLEYLELWTRILGPPPNKAAKHTPEAEEVRSSHVQAETREALRNCRKEDESALEMEPLYLQGIESAACRTQHHDLINQEYATLLGTVMSRNKHQWITGSGTAELGTALDEFLHRVIFQIINCIPFVYERRHSSRTRLVHVKPVHVHTALRLANQAAGAPPAQIFAGVLRRNLDADRLEALSCASDSSESSSGPGSGSTEDEDGGE